MNSFNLYKIILYFNFNYTAKSSCSKYNESPKKSTNTDSELDVKTISNNSFLESSK